MAGRCATIRSVKKRTLAVQYCRRRLALSSPVVVVSVSNNPAAKEEQQKANLHRDEILDCCQRELRRTGIGERRHTHTHWQTT